LLDTVIRLASPGSAQTIETSISPAEHKNTNTQLFPGVVRLFDKLSKSIASQFGLRGIVEAWLSLAENSGAFQP